jgi:hypothetical protein
LVKDVGFQLIYLSSMRAFQLMLAVWWKASRGRPRCDALSYGVPRLSR